MTLVGRGGAGRSSASRGPWRWWEGQSRSRWQIGLGRVPVALAANEAVDHPGEWSGDVLVCDTGKWDRAWDKRTVLHRPSGRTSAPREIPPAPPQRSRLVSPTSAQSPAPRLSSPSVSPPSFDPRQLAIYGLSGEWQHKHYIRHKHINISQSFISSVSFLSLPSLQPQQPTICPG